MAKNTASKSLTFTYEGKTFTFTGTPLEVANARRTVESVTTKMSALTAKSVKRGRGRPANGPKALTETQQIRAWARENGLQVGQRGRIAPEVREAFAKANG